MRNLVSDFTGFGKLWYQYINHHNIDLKYSLKNKNTDNE